MLTNSFDDLVREDFFTSQEILFGKSICDICLNTPKYISQGLSDFKREDDDEFVRKTFLYQLVKDDHIRLEALKDVGLFPRKMIINVDFNYDSTIQKA